MKKNIFSLSGLVFLIASFTGYSQPSADPSGFLPDTWAKENQVIPASPGAAALGNYGNVPINYYTGTPNVSIPLYTIGGQYVSTSIAIAYDPNSLKVAALPSSVGWGWTLQGGGAITRTVRGAPDMQKNYYAVPAYAQQNGIDLNSFPPNGVTVEWAEFMARVTCGELEVQPDIYHFNMPGYSGSFVVTPEGEVVQKEFQDLVIVPYFEQALPGTGSDNLSRFTIWGPYGRTYRFDADDTEWTYFKDDYDTEPNYDCSGNYSPEKYYYSSWHLSSIESAGGGFEELEFIYGTIDEDYFEEKINTYQDDSETYKIAGISQWCPAPGGSPTYSHGSTSSGTTVPQVHDRRYLKTIIFRLGGEEVEKVEFSVDAIPNDPLSSGIKLYSMGVYRRWQGAGYETLPGGTVPVQRLVYVFDYDPGNPHGRLTLKSVTEQGFEMATNTWTVKPPHVFEYEGWVPDVASNAIDHWGFYNGANNGTNLIPNVDVGCNIYGGGASRDASPQQMSGILKKITYPTGGRTEFVFENHAIQPDEPRNSNNLASPVNGTVGGFRIKSITDYDSDGTLALAREYDYENEDGTSSGLLMYALEYYKESVLAHFGFVGCSEQIPLTGYCEDYECSSLTVFASSVAPYAGRTGGHVGYSRVVERVTGGSGNGKTAYQYINAYPGQNEIWNIYNGTLKTVKVYNKDGQVVREEFHIDPLADLGPDHGLEDCSVSGRCNTGYHPFTVVSDVYQSNRTRLCELANGHTEWRHIEDPYGDCTGGSGIFHTKYSRLNQTIEQKWKRNTYKRTVEHFYDVTAGTVDKVDVLEYTDPNTILPTAFEFRNSDNKLHRTEVEYQGMYPLKVTKKVDGQITGGMRQTLTPFGKPLNIYEILGGGSELLRGVVGGYTNGRPNSYTYMSFPTEEFTWVNGLLTKRQRSTWIWEYDYDERRLMTSFTDIDGQVTNYAHDGLFRLVGTSGRGGNTQLGIQYNYGLLQGGGNFVLTTASFSDYDDQVTKQTYDGLGRPKKTVKIGYGPMHEDIVAEDIHYDMFGRVEKKVNIADAQPGVNYVNLTYDGSPLNRTEGQWFPDGFGIQTAYGAENNHYKTQVKDENGNPTTTLTDIIGQDISNTDALGGVTSYKYDDRGNLLEVANAIGQKYTYIYDSRNRMVSSKVPGAECQEFVYEDGRDLLIARQDGNLRLEDKWIATEYDVFGRATKTGFYSFSGLTPICNLPPGQPQAFPYNFAPVAEETLTETGYDAQGGGCSSSYVPIGKKTYSAARVLNPDGSLGALLATNYCYDDYGRLESTTSDNWDGGADLYRVNQYNMADLVLEEQKSHNSELSAIFKNSFDHAMRNTQVKSGDVDVIANYTYNSRDQLKYKVLGGGLASLSYGYTPERGWMNRINRLPLTGAPVPNCDEPAPPTGDPSDKTCATCGEDLMTLEDLLEARFSSDILFDCYIPCDCNARCTPDNATPCPDTTVTVLGQTVVIDPKTLNFPTDMYNILGCDGSQEYVPGENIPDIGGNYAVVGKVPLESEAQVFKVETPEGVSVLDLGQLSDLLNQGTDEGVDIKTGKKPSCNTCPTGPICTPQDSITQTGYVNTMALLNDIAQLQLPTNLVKTRLCDGRELYFFDEELENIPGNVERLQEIVINDGSQELVVDTSGARMTVSGYMAIRTLTYPDRIDYFYPCEENKCPHIGEKYNAKSVGSSTIFSEYNNDPPYHDLLQYYTGGENSLVQDGVNWEIHCRYWSGNTPPCIGIVTESKEAQWDMQVSLPADSEIKSYEVHVIVPYYRATGGFQLMLNDGNGTVVCNGGQDYIELMGAYTLFTPPLDLVFKPDVLPTTEQLSKMKVAIHDLGGTVNDIRIDAVYVVVDYIQVCDRCNLPAPTCSGAEYAAQQASLNAIKIAAAQTPISSIPLPTNLYRVQLCGGDETYLLQHELAMLAGNYVILQTIAVASLNQEFPGSAAPLPTPGAPGATRTDLFAMKLRYYSRDPHLETGGPQFYNNGNIAAQYWQVPNRDQGVYSFSYDALNRLGLAKFANRKKEGANSYKYYNFDAYNEQVVQYDAIGNILHLKRNGPFAECAAGSGIAYSYGPIDDLEYDYGACGQAAERLCGITEHITGDAALKGYAPNSGTYTYDANGNMATDAESGVSLEYNILNLPRTATNGYQTVNWYYDADGNKLRKSGGINSVTYADGFEKYDNGSRFISHPEGRWAYIADPADPLDWHNEFYIRDHLGNTRVVFSDLNGDQFIQVSPEDWTGAPVGDGYTEIMQENHYYPFGMNQEGTWHPVDIAAWENPYQYNGKELERELGLDWNDYGARYYDPAVGRFTGVDPLADEYAAISPYVYTANNPIKYIDPNGMYFTEGSQGYLDKLNTNMENRIASYDRRIAKAAAKGKDKKVERLTNQRNSLNAEFDATRVEIAELSASDQAYSIYVSDKFSESGPVPGMGTDRGGASFNFSNGVFEIALPNGNDVGMISHELKHAHQFETGQYSVGPELGGEYNNLLYDKTDEVAGYTRGAFFGQKKYSIHDLPSEYNNVATGPVDVTSHPNLKHILNAPSAKQQKAFQGIANATGHAFRVNGKTYFKKR